MTGRLANVALLGGGTVLAALFGLAFQSLLAFHFGAGAETDAWFMSLSIFAFLAKLLMLTHLKSIALPVYRRLAAHDVDEGRRFARGLLVWATLGAAVLALLLVLGAPLLVDALAPGYRGEMRTLTVTLVRIRTPALAFLAGSTAGLVVMESGHRFGVTVTSQKVVPALLTLLLFLAVADRFGMVGVGWIGLAGGVAGGMVGIVAAARVLRPSASRASSREASAEVELRAVGGQWLRFGGSNAASFLGEWAFRIAASLLPVGLFSAVLYGRMVHDLLHGAVNDPAQSVSLPRFAAAAADGGEGGAGDVETVRTRVGREVRESLATLGAVTLPTAAFVALTAPWMVALLFGRGRFLEDGMTGPAAMALRIFALGFLLQGLNQLLFAGAFAAGRAPLVNRVQAAGHLARAAALVPATLAFSFVGLVGAQVGMNALVLLLLVTFAPAEWRLGFGGALGALLGPQGRRVLGATAAVALAVGWGSTLLPEPLSVGSVGRLGALALLGGVWFGGYLALAWVTGVAPVRSLVGRLRPRAAALLIGLAVVAGTPAASAAQQVGPTLLPADHWSVAVLELLEAEGALPVGAARSGPLSGARAERLLAEAADRSEPARAALGRLRAEAATAGVGISARVRMGYREARAGEPVGSGGRAGLDLRLGAPGGRFFAGVEVDAGPGGSDRALATGAVGARLGPLSLQAGRTRVRLGGGAGGSLVLGPAVPLDGILLTTERPFALPALGATTLTLGLFPQIEYEAVEDPWFALLRLTAAPAPWLLLGASRGALVGGRFGGGAPPYDPVPLPPDDRSVSAGDVLGILLGRVNRFDDQVWGFDLRASLASAGIPALVYGEIGLEDNERSFGDGAVLAGILVTAGGGSADGRAAGAAGAAAPGPAKGVAPTLTFRYEYAGVGEPGRWCAWCQRGLPTWWYQHNRFLDGWRVGGELLGHPLGGYGLQHLAEVGVYDPGMAVRLRVAGTRLRRDGLNLLESGRPGWAWGLRTRAAARVRERWEFSLGTDLEWGDAGWRAGAAELGIAWLWAEKPRSEP